MLKDIMVGVPGLPSTFTHVCRAASPRSQRLSLLAIEREPAPRYSPSRWGLRGVLRLQRYNRIDLPTNSRPHRPSTSRIGERVGAPTPGREIVPLQPEVWPYHERSITPTVVCCETKEPRKARGRGRGEKELLRL